MNNILSTALSRLDGGAGFYHTSLLKLRQRDKHTKEKWK